jgi:hypothetical protein
MIIFSIKGTILPIVLSTINLLCSKLKSCIAIVTNTISDGPEKDAQLLLIQEYTNDLKKASKLKRYNSP